MKSKSINLFLCMIYSCLCVVSPRASGWGLHYLVTDLAFAAPEFEQLLNEQIPTEPLDIFLKDQSPALKMLFDNYYTWLASTGTKRFKPQSFDIENPTQETFLKTARLNPRAQFPLVRRLLPSQLAHGELFPIAKLSPTEKIEPQFSAVFKLVGYSLVSARSILNTFADEPDWTIDTELWSHSEYGYGVPPYGKLDGNSAGAAFHTKFLHENWVVKLFAPDVLEGMSHERLELFARLSKLAFQTSHPYWGYRFAAMGIHYLQDLSQPYHAKAAPHADFWFYLRFIFSGDKESIKSDTTQVVYNRHHLYEDFVKVLLQRFYLKPDEMAKSMATSLSEGTRVWTEFLKNPTTSLLFSHVAKLSADQSYALDQGVIKAYGPRLAEDPTYDFERDSAYNSESIFIQNDPNKLSILAVETKKALIRTGEATRTFLLYCMSGKK